MHLAKKNVPLYLRNKRAQKASQRSRRDAKTLSIKKASAVAFDRAFGRSSQIVRLLADSAEVESKQFRRMGFYLPSAFSVMDDPEQALSAIAALGRAMLYERLSSVFIDFSKLKKYDLGANALLDVLVEELTTQARRTRRTIRWRGNYPKDPALVRFVRALGVIKRLKILHEYPSTHDEVRLRLFDERCKHYIVKVRPREADRKSTVTVRFADHLDECLRTIGLELSLIAKSKLCDYLGEILDNVEEHAGMLDWSIQGYLDTQLATPMCEITIFNFGTPIAETFDRLPADHFTKKQIHRYMDLHSQKRFFGHTWRKEDLYTLLSLQGNVSSKNLSTDDTRGNGTGDLIEFFQRMHDECSNGGEAAKMVIVSGSTYILFDGKYRLAPNSEGVRTIAFNQSNDLRERPDESYVRKLAGVSFPGTLISLKFPLSVGKSTVAASSGEQS